MRSMLIHDVVRQDGDDTGSGTSGGSSGGSGEQAAQQASGLSAGDRNVSMPSPIRELQLVNTDQLAEALRAGNDRPSARAEDDQRVAAS